MRFGRVISVRLGQVILVSGFVAACASDPVSSEAIETASEKLVYGSDGRLEIGQLSDPGQIAWADATATIFDSVDVNCSAGNCALTTKPFGDSQGGVYIPGCPGEPHLGQPQGGHCTGFLIAPDLFVSAGHCFESQFDCSTQSIVFGFQIDASGQAATMVPDANVYGCEKIVARAATYDSLDGLKDVDFALVKLDRPVANRTPLAIRQSGIVPDDAELATIGSPLGLPLKYAAGATLRSNIPSNDKFALNLDASKGNSGAPVINVATGIVEGIVSAGPANEFVFERQTDGTTCARSLHCSDTTGCPGPMPWVHAARIASIVEVLEGRSCYDKIQNGQETDVDCGGPVCGACLMDKTCQSDSDCYQFPYDCRQSVCNQSHKCVLDIGTCECLTDSDCDDHISCTTTSCNTAQYSCEETSNTCECSQDSDCDDNNACTRDTCSATTRTCGHDASACAPQCNESTALDMGNTANVVTVDSNACIQVRDHYPAWWGRRTMQLMTWDNGTYPVPFTWTNACSGSSGASTFTRNWQTAYLNETDSNCATVISLKGDGRSSIRLTYY